VRTSTRLLVFWLAVVPVVAAPILLASPDGRPAPSSLPALVVLAVAWLVVLLGLLARRRSESPATTATPGPVSNSASSSRRIASVATDLAASVAADPVVAANASSANAWERWALAGARTSDRPEPDAQPWRLAVKVAMLSLGLGLVILFAAFLVLGAWVDQVPPILQCVLALGIALVVVGRGHGLRGRDWGRAGFSLVVVFFALGFVLILVLGSLPG
jgi:hypothetical protein